MGWFSKLFLTPKTIDTAVETGAKIATGLMEGLDEVWHTPQEKSEARQKANETLLEFWKSIAAENTEQSKGRRKLAMMTFKVYFFFLLASAVMYGFSTEYAKFSLSLAGIITFLVTMIAAIYFGPHQIQKIWKKKE